MSQVASSPRTTTTTATSAGRRLHQRPERDVECFLALLVRRGTAPGSLPIAVTGASADGGRRDSRQNIHRLFDGFALLLRPWGELHLVPERLEGCVGSYHRYSEVDSVSVKRCTGDQGRTRVLTPNPPSFGWLVFSSVNLNATPSLVRRRGGTEAAFTRRPPPPKKRGKKCDSDDDFHLFYA